jgi:hypothetical protein
MVHPVAAEPTREARRSVRRAEHDEVLGPRTLDSRDRGAEKDSAQGMTDHRVPLPAPREPIQPSHQPLDDRLVRLRNRGVSEQFRAMAPRP